MECYRDRMKQQNSKCRSNLQVPALLFLCWECWSELKFSQLVFNESWPRFKSHDLKIDLQFSQWMNMTSFHLAFLFLLFSSSTIPCLCPLWFLIDIGNDKVFTKHPKGTSQSSENLSGHQIPKLSHMVIVNILASFYVSKVYLRRIKTHY